MSDLKNYINRRKKTNPSFNEGFDEGYETFRIGVLLKQARLEAGMTQEEVAVAIGTKKTAISRLENHSEDAKLSTLRKYTKAIGKHIEIKIASGPRPTPDFVMEDSAKYSASSKSEKQIDFFAGADAAMLRAAKKAIAKAHAAGLEPVLAETISNKKSEPGS